MIKHILFISKESLLDYRSRIEGMSKKDLVKQYVKLDSDFTNRIMISDKLHHDFLCLMQNLWPDAVFISSVQMQSELVLIRDADLIISVGGDEHFKSVVHMASRDKLFFNICSNSLYSQGALASCRDFNNLKRVKIALSNGEYSLQNWTCLDLNWSVQHRQNWVMDTLYLGAKLSSDMSHYRLTCQSQLEEQKSSGLLVVTGAGSSGWFKSIAGQCFSRTDKQAAFKVREPYFRCSYPINLLEGYLSDKDTIRVDSMMMKKEGIVTLDSILEYPFAFGDRLDISISDTCLCVLDFSFIR